MEIQALQKQLGLAHQHVIVQGQIIEEANATLVVQNLGLKKMNDALHEQEGKGVTDRAKLFKGKAQCLSSDEFYHEVLAVEEGRKTKAAGKERKKLERARKKEKKLEIEREWAERKRVHAELVEAWTAECSRLTELGNRKKDLPPKPKLGKKPKVPVADDDGSDESDDIDEDVDG
jgi:predicted aminopeptidase